MKPIDFSAVPVGEAQKSNQIRVAADELAKEGFVVLDGILSPQLVNQLKGDFDRSYSQYLDDRDRDDTLRVGDRRYMITVKLAGLFGDPLVYANPFVVAVIREALGEDAILESFGAVVSLPGSKPQKAHQDGCLFSAGISRLLPAHALTVVIPLIEMNNLHGSTSVWPGSHRWANFDETKTSKAPVIPIGACAIWDFRLFHGGNANDSPVPRPILYGTYARRWFRDPGNFPKSGQRRIACDDDFYQTVPEDCRNLFNIAR